MLISCGWRYELTLTPRRTGESRSSSPTHMTPGSAGRRSSPWGGHHHTDATFYENVRVLLRPCFSVGGTRWRMEVDHHPAELRTRLPSVRPAAPPASTTGCTRGHRSPVVTASRPIDHHDVKRALGEIHAMWRINELLNWQVAAAGEDINVADAASTKVFGTERIQYIGRLAEEIVGKYGNPAESDTAELLDWLDSQTKAQPGDHLRWRRQRSHARDDRRGGPQGAEGASMTDECQRSHQSKRSRPPSSPSRARAGIR